MVAGMLRLNVCVIIGTMYQSDSAPIWLSTSGLLPESPGNIKGKAAVLKWDIMTQIVTLTIVDDKELPLATVLSINISSITKALLSTTDCILKVDKAFYIIQPRTSTGDSIETPIQLPSNPILALATSEANSKLQQFGQYLRSVIPDRVAGGRVSVKTRIILGAIFGVVMVIAITAYSLMNK